MSAVAAHPPSADRRAWFHSPAWRFCVVSLWLVTLAGAIAIGAKTAHQVFRDQLRLEGFSPSEADSLRRSLDSLHLSVTSFVWIGVTFSVLQMLLLVGLAGLLISQKWTEPFVVWLALSFTAVSQAVFPPDVPELMHHSPGWMFVARVITAVGIGGFFLLPLLFPSGRPVPRWSVVVVIYVAATVVAAVFWPNWQPVSPRVGTVADTVSTIVLLLAGLASQIYRYRRVSTTIERQQTKWVMFAVAIAFPLFFAGDFIIRNGNEGMSTALIAILMAFLMPLSTALVPLAITIAVMRYRLYDIDLVISRTVVFLVMSTVVVGLYVAVVVGLGQIAHADSSFFLSLVATALVAVLFQPIRARAQRTVNRMLFGERDDPYAVLSRLGQRLEGTFAHQDILPTIVRTLTEALRLPYAAVYLGTVQPALAASAGQMAGEPLRLPLTYQQAAVGELVVAPRSPGEQFGAADRRLLEDLARQIGVAAHSVVLAQDLQHSRERIVTAREEERRRLRRDLHDGLGAQLAALSIQAGALRHEIRREPGSAVDLASELQDELRAAVADIRRLVHGLRPPALDDVGLLTALRERATRYSAGGLHYRDGETIEGSPSLVVDFDAPATLPVLPAAIEVALFRIVDEGLTNVTRHAGATYAVVRLAIDRELCLTIEDDGSGIAPSVPAGVGMISMRERAEELGGSFRISPGPGGRGTALTVRLPLPGTAGASA